MGGSRSVGRWGRARATYASSRRVINMHIHLNLAEAMFCAHFVTLLSESPHTPRGGTCSQERQVVKKMEKAHVCGKDMDAEYIRIQSQNQNFKFALKCALVTSTSWFVFFFLVVCVRS